jgi:predicted esterase
MWLGFAVSLPGMEVVLKDGRVLRGKRALVDGMNPMPAAKTADGAGAVPLIEVLDDELRRTFFSIRQVAQRRPDEASEVPAKIPFRQRVRHAGPTIKTVGPLLQVLPFDEFGRRTVVMLTAQGEVKIVQAITELTPTYTKVEGVTHVWDMRIATSSIPQESLTKLLKAQCKEGDVEDVKRVANFYLQCERNEDAARELEAFLTEHPEDAKLKREFGPLLQAIRQRSAKQMLSELALRREAGQHQFVLRMLKKFPTEGTSGETIQAVRDMLGQYQANETSRKRLVERMEGLAKQAGDAAVRKRIEPILQEISAELSVNTMDRMAAFRELGDDQTLQASDKLALAVSGWLLGAKGANPRLSTALSLVEVRRLILQFFAASNKIGRDELLLGFRSEEGASPALVAQVLANMKPPVAVDPPEEEGQPYAFEVPGLSSSSPAIRCLVQLPPEYDPHRRYPAILTLHGPGFTPEQQIDWWAGPRVKGGWRAGQASRRGYIVIAPDWTLEHQKQYQYSAREHAAALDSLRAACQRFAIDTDRVFLSGHSFGGDAAWDIGLGHPDLWAGVIPIVAKADKYCALYWENAALVPYYFVCGELDSSRMIANSRDWDRYLRKGYNVTVVEYQGRGHENFSDEILRLFDWMGRLRRNFSPKKFGVVTMRPWDNFFWWLELRQLPPKAMIAPENWPPPRGTLAVQTDATVTKTNGILLQTGAAQATVWLSPDVLDLARRFTVKINGKDLNTSAASLAGDLGVLLEDARSRGDRQHPFWSKIETPTGRVIRN